MYKKKNKAVNCLPNVTTNIEWVLTGEGIATVKINGEFYKLYGAKNERKIPENTGSPLLFFSTKRYIIYER